jgi:hypothetical protein
MAVETDLPNPFDSKAYAQGQAKRRLATEMLRGYNVELMNALDRDGRPVKMTAEGSFLCLVNRIVSMLELPNVD